MYGLDDGSVSPVFLECLLMKRETNDSCHIWFCRLHLHKPRGASRMDLDAPRVMGCTNQCCGSPAEQCSCMKPRSSLKMLNPEEKSLKNAIGIILRRCLTINWVMVLTV